MEGAVRFLVLVVLLLVVALQVEDQYPAQPLEEVLEQALVDPRVVVVLELPLLVEEAQDPLHRAEEVLLVLVEDQVQVELEILLLVAVVRQGAVLQILVQVREILGIPQLVPLPVLVVAQEAAEFHPVLALVEVEMIHLMIHHRLIL